MVSDRRRRNGIMPQKRYRPEEIIAKLREAEVLLGQGSKVAEVIKSLGISEVTYYRWRKEFGGMDVSQAKRLKELEREIHIAVSMFLRGFESREVLPVRFA
jgi:putative transposase